MQKATAENIKSYKFLRILLYPLSIAKQVVSLPKYVHKQQLSQMTVNKSVDRIRDALSDNSANLNELSDKIEKISSRINAISSKINILYSRKTDIGHATANRKTDNTPSMTIAEDHSLDWFYKLFEDRFRGPEDIIKKRVSEYGPYFDKLTNELKHLPIVDIGCGRGEFLSFAKDSGLIALGIDVNIEMVDRSRELGFEAIQADALEYLSKQTDNSLAAITGFHIVEHIPLVTLIRLFEECYRVIAPGGFVLLETPNPRNILVSTNTFHIDPSHLKPIPQELLSFALESVGFKTEVIESHPIKETINTTDGNEDIQRIVKAFYGPQDYAVLANK